MTSSIKLIIIVWLCLTVAIVVAIVKTADYTPLVFLLIPTTITNNWLRLEGKKQ